MGVNASYLVDGVGVIPSDWLSIKADEICSKITKGTTPPKSEIVDDRKIPFLRVNNLTFGGELDLASPMIFVSSFAHKKTLSRSIAYPNDILMNIVGPPLGKMALLKDDFPEYNLNQAIIIYRVNSEKVCTRFFFSYLRSNFAQQWLETHSKKTSGQQNLTIEICKSLPIPLPPLSEQKKIANILLIWDKAITNTEQLLANTQQYKKALMQKLLTGKVQFSGFTDNWKSYRLGKVFKERVETNCVDLPLLSITTAEGVISRDDVGKKDTSNADKAKYRRICPNDIGYNTMRMWQGVSGVSDKEGIVSPAYTILIPQSEIYPLYAAYLFKLPALINEFYRHSQGLVSDTWNLKYSHFSKIKWSFPSVEEQIKIANVLSASDKEINLLEAKLNFLRQEKKALMQQLLTGKRRVRIN